MKYRVVDVLRCAYDGAPLEMIDAQERHVPFGDQFDDVRCANVCAYTGRVPGTVDGPTPADCTSCYGREIGAGSLRCSECGRVWPIVRGIPRLLPDALADDVKKAQETFSHEWKMFRFGERNWGQDLSYRRELFLDALGASPNDLAGKLIFDAGCGSGLLSMEMANTFGMEVVALDLAFGIENAYEQNDSPYVHFVQGSVLDAPVSAQAFDYLYCAGVLVATPDTFEGFKEIVNALKPAGRCFIWVYHPITPEFYPESHRKLATYNWIRVNVTSRLPIKVQYGLYLAAIPPFLVKQWVELRLGKRETRLTWREKMQALFDFFSPKYQHRHAPEEVCEWFRQLGFRDVSVCNIGTEGFGVRGDLAAVRE